MYDTTICFKQCHLFGSSRAESKPWWTQLSHGEADKEKEAPNVRAAGWSTVHHCTLIAVCFGGFNK